MPPAGHEAWRDILTRRVGYDLDFFAAKILLGWLLLEVDSDPSPEMLGRCAEKLRQLYAQNAGLPCVQRDLALMAQEPSRGGGPGTGIEEVR